MADHLSWRPRTSGTEQYGASCATGPAPAGEASPHDDILINVEAIRGAIRKGNWKLVKIATLPGRTELFDLNKDPGEKDNAAADHPEIVGSLKHELMAAYAKQQKPSEWIGAPTAILRRTGKDSFRSGF